MVSDGIRPVSGAVKDIDRFWSLVEIADGDGCWIYSGTKRSGYGKFYWLEGGRQFAMAHRVAYEHVRGPIPNGLTIDHLCRNRSCVRPDHLEAVTLKENILRGECEGAKNARKTNCPNGHALSPDNVVSDGWGRLRRCRTCQNARARAKWARRKS